LLKSVEILEQRKDSVGLDWLELGIPWQPQLNGESARASMSRSLSRLESRGLIKAPNVPSALTHYSNIVLQQYPYALRQGTAFNGRS
jgi:hypothetical protein